MNNLQQTSDIDFLALRKYVEEVFGSVEAYAEKIERSPLTIYNAFIHKKSNIAWIRTLWAFYEKNTLVA